MIRIKVKQSIPGTSEDITMHLFATVLFYSFVFFASAAVIFPRQQTELYLIRLRLELLTQKLYEMCPDLVDNGLFIGKREIIDRLPHKETMQIEYKVYNHIQLLLMQCYSETSTERNRDETETASTSTTTQIQSTTTATQTTTATTPFQTTTTTSIPTTTTATSTSTTNPTPTTTTTTPTSTTTFTQTTTTYYDTLPSECISSSTRTLADSWRKNSPRVSPYNTDLGTLDGGRAWFRFWGAAGSLLKNTCPTQRSCGSDGAFWSDSPLPTRVGETINITFYESYHYSSVYADSCRVLNFRGRATRCSEDREGVVYIMDDDMSGGADTFCGMD